MDLRYDSIAALIEAAKQSGRKLSELVLEQQAVQMEQSVDRSGAHGRLLRNSAGRRAHVAGRA